MVHADGSGRNSPVVVGTPMPEGALEAPNGEKAPVEGNSHAVAIPPS